MKSEDPNERRPDLTVPVEEAASGPPTPKPTPDHPTPTSDDPEGGESSEEQAAHEATRETDDNPSN